MTEKLRIDAAQSLVRRKLKFGKFGFDKCTNPAMQG